MKLAQSNVIFFALFVGFVIFVTIRGDLPAYLNVVFKTQAASPTQTGEPSATGGSSGSSLGSIGSALNGIDQLTGSNTIGSAVTSFRNMLPSLPSLSGIGSFLGL